MEDNPSIDKQIALSNLRESVNPWPALIPILQLFVDQIQADTNIAAEGKVPRQAGENGAEHDGSDSFAAHHMHEVCIRKQTSHKTAQYKGCMGTRGLALKDSKGMSAAGRHVALRDRSVYGRLLRLARHSGQTSSAAE